MKHRWIWWLGLYVVLLAALVGGLFVARRQVIAAMGTPEAIAEWREWKSTTEKEAQTPGPVKRRAVKADEPPTLLMFRDHFGAVLVGLGVPASLLYFFGVFVLRGIFGSSGQLPSHES